MPGAYSLSAMFVDIDNDGEWIGTNQMLRVAQLVIINGRELLLVLGNLDLAISGDFYTSRLYWGTVNGTFVDGTTDAGVGLEENGMGSTIGDFDNDGHQDWFVTSIYICEEYRKPYFEAYGPGGGMIFGYTGNRLYKNNGQRKFTDKTDDAGVRPGGWAWGAAFLDFNNDGYQDIVMTNGTS